MVPRSGWLSDDVTSSTISRPLSVSPGRTGASQRSSSIPDDPWPDAAAEQRVDVEPHPHRAGVPAARDQAAEDRILRRLGVEVERLRVELACEGDDLVLADDLAPELVDLARLEVLEGVLRHFAQPMAIVTSLEPGNAAVSRRRLDGAGQERRYRLCRCRSGA